MSASEATTLHWLHAGDEIFPAMLSAIDAAQRSIRLETYTYLADPIGERFREALVRAQQRGARVRVLIDAVGSHSLPANYFEALTTIGGEVRWFNPITLKRFGIRNHRKLLVCDEQVAFVGGFNIASEYDGDGVTHGWCDIGIQIERSLTAQLAASFNEMFALADFRYKRFMRLRRFTAKKIVAAANELLLLSGPGRGPSPIHRALRRDLARARTVQVMMAYFLPTWRLRRALMRVARRGGKVQLILAGKSDVFLSQLAGRSLYRRLLRAGIEIYEYQPQILHAKLIIINGAVYVGSANLDPRSLYINYELMLRFQDKKITAGAQAVFAKNLKLCERIEQTAWRKSRTVWRRLKQRWAYFLLARVDPYVALRQLRTLRD